MITPLGKILVQLGYAKHEHIQEALKRQVEIDNELRPRQSMGLPSILLSLNMARDRWKDRRLGGILMEMGVVTPDQIEEALRKQKEISSKHVDLISNEEAVALMEIPSIINSALNVYELLSNVMTCCNTLIDSTASALFICDEKTEKLAASFYWGHVESSQIYISPAGSVAGWVIENNEAILVDDVGSDTRFFSETEAFPGVTIRSVACVPVNIKWQTVGAIEVINKKQDASFSKKDLVLLSTIANQIGLSIDNIRLLAQLGQTLDDLKKAQNQIIQTEKLKAIGEMTSGIAHDFNNLLMGIQGNISLIQMDPTYPQYERLKNIEKQVQSGTRLTSHLLGYARKGSYKLKPIDLNELVEETSKTFGRTKKGITIHRELAENLFPIEADSGKIEQVLLNLLVNATDAMPGGGDLILKTTNTTSEDMKGKLRDPQPGSYALLMVTDTGMGMDKKTMDRIFDPFFTTKERGRGTGLGLATTYETIKGHNGYIDVESKKGRGTSFSIYLPASEKKVRKVVKTVERFIAGTGTVLLVDDDEAILEVGRELLKAMGYRTFEAKNGKEAIEVYLKNRDDVDIVLLDMVMPNMGGGEAYDRMKEINPDIKVLLSSGYSVDGEATEILERGCNGFIQKPFNMRDLSGKIREILGN